jgi:hypothetical protein
MKPKIVDKILEKYLDKEFKNAEYVKGYQDEDLREPWDVFLNESGEIIIGGPTDDNQWFYSGPLLAYLIKLLDISNNELSEGIKKYINEKYDLNLKSVY